MDCVNDLFKEVQEEARQIGIPVSNYIKEDVVINSRAKSRFGCCKRIRKGNQEIFEIEISDRLLGCKTNAIKQTLAHEILHTCPQCGNHGKRWQLYANQMNKAYGYNIKRTDSAEQLGIEEDGSTKRKTPKENYVIVCKKCGARISRTRMSNVIKHTQKYRCRCGGSLERIK